MTRTVLHFIDSADFGGTEQMLLTLLAGLDRQRWRPVLLHHPEPGIAQLVERARRLSVETRAVPRMQGRRGATWIPRLVRELRAERPAVFHAHLNWPLACTYGLLAAALARIPAVIATQQLFAEMGLPRSVLLQRLVSIGVDRYIAVSHEVARRLRAACLFPARKVEIIHNATPLAPFSRPPNLALRAILTRGTHRPIVLTLARLDEQKGLSYLLAAAALVPEALFALAGEGRARARLEAQSRELGVADRVIFLGHRDDVPDLLATCDLFVLPSLYEGLPLSVLEAMAAGKPVIASAIGGTDEAVVDGVTGLLVPPRDPAALAGAIRTVLSDPALAERLATGGKARVQEKFSAETMVERTTRLYDEVLSSPSPRPEASYGNQ